MTMRRFVLTVEGDPAPAGSKRAFKVRKKVNGKMVETGKVIVTDDSKRSKPWKQQIRDEVRQATRSQTYPLLGGVDGALMLNLTFYVRRPKYHYSTRKRDRGVLLAEYRQARPTGKPDLLKLTRAVEDALIDRVYRDDSQIVREVLEKRYADPGTPPRVVIEVMEWDDSRPAQERWMPFRTDAELAL